MYWIFRLFYSINLLFLFCLFINIFSISSCFILYPEFRLRFLYQVDNPKEYKICNFLFYHKASLVSQFINIIITFFALYPVDDYFLIFPVPLLLIFFLWALFFTYYSFFYIPKRQQRFKNSINDLLRLDDFLTSSVDCAKEHSYSFSEYRLPFFMLPRHKFVAEEVCSFLYLQIGHTLPSHEAFCKSIMDDVLFVFATRTYETPDCISLLNTIAYEYLTTIDKNSPSYVFQLYNLYYLLWDKTSSTLIEASTWNYTSKRKEDERTRINSQFETATYVPSWERKE